MLGGSRLSQSPTLSMFGDFKASSLTILFEQRDRCTPCCSSWRGQCLWPMDTRKCEQHQQTHRFSTLNSVLCPTGRSCLLIVFCRRLLLLATSTRPFARLVTFIVPKSSYQRDSCHQLILKTSPMTIELLFSPSDWGAIAA